MPNFAMAAGQPHRPQLFGSVANIVARESQMECRHSVLVGSAESRETIPWKLEYKIHF